MRRKPYTARGINRVPCAKCGAPSTAEWRICADNAYRGLCSKHDLELNELVMKWAFGNSRDDALIAYRKSKTAA